jgi:hypothetical protein
MGTVHENLCTLVIISRWIFFRVRNFSDTRCRENQNTHFMFSNFFQKLHHVWDNVEKYGTAREVTDDNIIWHIHFACWMTMASIQIHTHTHTLRICNMYCLSTAYMNVPKCFEYIARLGRLVTDYQDSSRCFKSQIASRCTMSCEDHYLCCGHDGVTKVCNIRLKG